MSDQKNVIMFVVLTMLVLGGYYFVMERFFPPPPQATTTTTNGAGTTATTAAGTTAAGSGQAAPGLPAAPAALATKPRPQALAESKRVEIRSDLLQGSISLTGGRLDDLTLAGYHETVDPNSPLIDLLNPPGAESAYYADFGWLAAEGSAVKLPGPDTVWTAADGALTPDHPVTLSWDNGQGLTFTRTIAVDRNYMFTVTDGVKNGGSAPAKLYPYARIRRVGTPKTSGYSVLHEGLLGVFGGSLKEVTYSGIVKAGVDSYDSTGGWLGITDKYWLVALVPTQADQIAAHFTHDKQGDTDVYLADFRDANPATLAPGASITSTSHVFAGAKIVHLLGEYRDQLGIPLFERAVDFGWFWFLTEPLFYVLDFLYRLIGNFGLAILALTICVRLVLFPLANKSFRAMNKMKALQPRMTELRERFKDDKQKLNQEMMELYKREKVNPAAGCLPIMVQIPVFFCLYKTFVVTIEMRHAPFFGWIRDLSAPDPTSWVNLFGLLPWGVPHDLTMLGPLEGIVGGILVLGIWPIIMGVTMWLQQKLNPAPPDPVQARIFMLLPIIFTFTLARFPAGLVIYWAWNNLLSITQQRFLMWQGNKKKH
jgi:YidC/Oxa1 family membrane protein insertase